MIGSLLCSGRGVVPRPVMRSLERQGSDFSGGSDEALGDLPTRLFAVNVDDFEHSADHVLVSRGHGENFERKDGVVADLRPLTDLDLEEVGALNEEPHLTSPEPLILIAHPFFLQKNGEKFAIVFKSQIL